MLGGQEQASRHCDVEQKRLTIFLSARKNNPKKAKTQTNKRGRRLFGLLVIAWHILANEKLCYTKF
jgi:hypothetical protein